MKNYEKAYNEALERAKKIHNQTEFNYKKDMMEEIFPELKESEDERIRGAIIDHLKDYNLTEWAAWLEKQGEQNPIINVPTREVILAIWDLGNEWKELTDGDISTEYGTQLDYIQKHWHESEYYLREKQGEQKTTDKVEPKFHEGDWIIDKQGIVHQIEKVIENVTNNTFAYDLVGGGYINEEVKSCRLWTIQDAKDGDVLVDVYGNIGIFQKNDDFDWSSYCSLGSNGGFRCFAIEHELDGSHPATKEQRDLLFKKIEEAGYQWDAKKKELKLLISNGGDFESNNSKQKSTWSDEDEKRIDRVCDFVWKNRKGDTDEIYQQEQDVNWLKSLKERLS